MSTRSVQAVVSYIKETYQLSERRACRVIQANRKVVRHKSILQSKDRLLKESIRELSSSFPRFGYRRIWALLKKDGWKVNRKKVFRLWRELGLQVRKTVRKKRAKGSKQDFFRLRKATKPNEIWSVDFLFDRIENGQRLKIMPIVDEFTRECKAIFVGKTFTSGDIQRGFTKLFELGDKPECIRSDNGPEFIAKELGAFLQNEGGKNIFIAPGSPWENGYVESFHARLRDECLNRELFYSILEAKVVLEDFREHYNKTRPHSSLNYKTPKDFREEWNKNQRLT